MPPVPKHLRDAVKRTVKAEAPEAAPTPPLPAVEPLRALQGPCRACNDTGRASNGGACYPCSLRRGATP